MEQIEHVALLTADPRVRDAVESTAAALGLGVRTSDTVDAALAAWPSARAVLVGADLAAGLASAAPRRRPRVYLVGFEAAELGTWSVPLGAGVIPLPQGIAWLSGVLGNDTREARVLAVVGGSGGVGASTLAAGFALASVRAGRSAALVDLDAVGGGIDLLLGAERAAGWRWPKLVGARGEVGDVRGVLPQVAGVTVVAMGRGDDAEEPSAESVHAVLGALGRHHELVVLDAGRVPTGASRLAVRGADSTVLLSGAGVRAVAASARVRRGLDAADAGVVVRAHRGGPPSEVVAHALGLPLWGKVPHDARLAGLAEAGEPPGAGRARWGRAVARVLERVLQEAVDVD